MYVIKDGNPEHITAYGHDCDISKLDIGGKWLHCREKFGKREHWYSEPLFIDTETSHIDENVAWVHQWAICWGGVAIVGRTTPQLVSFLCRLSDYVKTIKSDKYKLLCYVHNLSYDMEYLRQFFPEHEPEFFAVKPHRILTAKYEQLEIRCSYLLTQKNLAKWGHDSAKHYQKLVGDYDYSKVRTPKDNVTDEEWAYQLNDVFTMWDAWHNDRLVDKYDARTVPLTSTGFVRNDCRNASKNDSKWRARLDKMQPEIEVYNAMEKAFSGGYTHGNRFYKMQTVSGVIGHRDFCSSYPARQMCNDFPMGKFAENTSIHYKNDVYNIMESMACLCLLRMLNPRLRDRTITAPYLGYSKLEKLSFCDELLDNGRVIKIDGFVQIWVTEYDLQLIDRQYTCDGHEIVKAYCAPKGKLPKWLRDTIYKYFRDKNTLKYTDPSNYMLAKAHLNGVYGMTCERNVRPDVIYKDGEWKEVEKPDEERKAALEKYINKKNTFLFFAWGLYTTAYARLALFSVMEEIGYENYLYSDTDSIFYISTPEIEKRIAEWNNDWNDHAISCNASIEYNGKLSILGEFTKEDDFPLDKFRFVHSKCYATEKDGKLSVTVAGVTKKWRSKPDKSNADELQFIDNLDIGFRFSECGGTRIKYNNEPLHEIEYKGCKIMVGASAIILDTDYVITDKDSMDEDDIAILNLISRKYISDTYENYIDIK